jgi:phosphatidylserine/phosphatidylglycerophosphate/cardiolipin synthase-like enzyme
MMQFLTSRWHNRFIQLVENTDSSLLICAPYIGRGPCERLTAALQRRKRQIDIYVLTDLSRDNMLCGATDVSAIASLVKSFPQSIVRFLPSLHAKVYISDAREAVVTSANLTDNGLWRNSEYGVITQNPTEVTRIRADILSYGNLGSLVTLSQLQAFAAVTDELRLLRVRAEASLRRKLRAEFDKKLDSMDEEVLRARAGDRSLDAILSDAIMYLLRERAMKTTEIHVGVQRIHPDLCDDSVDRVINGVHFGKKWKHAVRRAQYHLKQRGKIKLLDGSS